MAQSLGCCRFHGHLVDDLIGNLVRQSFLGNDRTYGVCRVWRDMLALGHDCGLHRIERLMRLQAMRG